ncbi:MAG: hypothetical protein GC154_08805 [bacterium]|nr:hypothetical protein [bacterium]
MKRVLLFWSLSAIVLFCVCGVMAQEPQALFRENFNGDSLQAIGWTGIASSGFQGANARIGLTPSNPYDTSSKPGRGVLITAAPGQGTLLFGPVIPVGDDPVVIRLSVLADSPGGIIAMGVFNVAPDGSIFTTDNTGFFKFDNDSAAFTDGYHRLTAIYDPKDGAVIPLFQFAVNPGADVTTVTGYFDDFEIFPLNSANVTDPGLRSLLGVTAGVEPTPTIPVPTMTPTRTPTQPPAPTPTPDQSAPDFELEWLLDISPQDDAYEAFHPDAEHDKNSRFAIVAADNTLGYQDILLREFDAPKGTISDPVTVNQTFDDTRTYQPSVEIDAGGDRVIAWQDDRRVDKSMGVFLNATDSFGIKLRNEDIWVNEPFQDTNAINPQIDMNSHGDMVVTWQDDRFFDTNIFARRFTWANNQFTPIDSKDIVINKTFENTAPSRPAVAVGEDGTIVSVWSDNRVAVNGTQRYDVYARVWSKTTQPTSDFLLPDSVKEIRVSPSDDVLDNARYPAIAVSNNYYFIVWINENPSTGQKNVQGALLNKSGEILVNAFFVDLGEEAGRAAAPSVAVWAPDQFIVTWFDAATGETQTLFYDAKNNQYLSDPIILLDQLQSVANTSVCVDDDYRFLSVWDGLIGGISDASGLSVIVNAPELRTLQSVPRMVTAPETGPVAKLKAVETSAPATVRVLKAARFSHETSPPRGMSAPPSAAAPTTAPTPAPSSVQRAVR